MEINFNNKIQGTRSTHMNSFKERISKLYSRHNLNETRDILVVEKATLADPAAKNVVLVCCCRWRWCWLASVCVVCVVVRPEREEVQMCGGGGCGFQSVSAKRSGVYYEILGFICHENFGLLKINRT